MKKISKRKQQQQQQKQKKKERKGKIFSNITHCASLPAETFKMSDHTTAPSLTIS